MIKRRDYVRKYLVDIRASYFSDNEIHEWTILSYFERRIVAIVFFAGVFFFRSDKWRDAVSGFFQFVWTICEIRVLVTIVGAFLNFSQFK